MKKIEKLEQVKKQNANLEKWGINHKFYNAYTKSANERYETINFDDIIWEEDVEEIIKNCKEFGIKTITISYTFSILFKILGMFQDNGCKVVCIKKILSQFTNFKTDEYDLIDAVEIEIC